MNRTIPPDILYAAGEPNSVAQVISSLSNNQAQTVKQLSVNSNLPLSQVASGLKLCRNRGWVSATQSQTRSKGRPQHLWRLHATPLEIITELEIETRSKLNLLSNAVEILQNELTK